MEKVILGHSGNLVLDVDTADRDHRGTSNTSPSRPTYRVFRRAYGFTSTTDSAACRRSLKRLRATGAAGTVKRATHP